MRCELHCPACGAHTIEFESYKSIILLAPNLALLQYACPGCRITLCATVKLPATLQHKLQQLAMDENPNAEKDIKHRTLPEDRNESTVYDQSKLSYAAGLALTGLDESIDILMPLKSCIVDQKEALEDFKQQIESIESVDDVIKEIGQGYSRESRE